MSGGDGQPDTALCSCCSSRNPATNIISSRGQTDTKTEHVLVFVLGQARADHTCMPLYKWATCWNRSRSSFAAINASPPLAEHTSTYVIISSSSTRTSPWPEPISLPLSETSTACCLLPRPSIYRTSTSGPSVLRGTECPAGLRDIRRQSCSI